MNTPPTTVALSICIPTYNRSPIVNARVRDILQCTSPDLEVVVLDNGSSDDTLARLAEIADARLRVYSNGTNRGVIFNVLHVLLKARGKHCVLLLDKDYVRPQAIPGFIAFLQQTNVVCGFCEYDTVQPRDAELFAPGMAALSNIAYTCHHPTGYFFDTARLRALSIETRFIDMAYVGHFCFEFILAELAFTGKAAIYHAALFSPETLEEAGRQKSFGTNASIEDAFFSPKGRLMVSVNFSRHIRTLPILESQKKFLIAERFVYGLLAATRGYQGIMANQKLCYHYNIASRPVGKLELLKIARHFYADFVAGVFVPRGLQQFTAHAGFVWQLGNYVARKRILRSGAPG